MKRYLIIVALLVSAAFAQAKVGDTITQINQQYGTLVCEVDGGKAYVGNGLFSLVVFDQAGICQGMLFMRINQSLSDDEVTRLDNENLPDGAGQWNNSPIPAKDQEPALQAQVWKSSNLPFIVASMRYDEPVTGMTMNARAYMDTRSADLFEKVGVLLQKASGFKFMLSQ